MQIVKLYVSFGGLAEIEQEGLSINMKQSRSLSISRQKARTGLLFVLPFIIGFVFFFIQPFIFTFYYSFCNIELAGELGLEPSWIGLGNYKDLFKDIDFWPAFTGTLSKLFSSVPMILIFSVFIAVILNQKFKGRTVARAIFFLPVIISSGVIIKILREDVFSQSIMSGAAQSAYIFQGAGIQQLLYSTSLPVSIINFLVNIINGVFDVMWKSGIQILVFLTAIQNVPSQLYEAATIEGATGWESFWKITFPMMSPMLVINLIYTTVDYFTDYQNPLMIMINRIGFENYRYAYACVLAIVYMAAMMAIISLCTFIMNKFVYYDSK